MTDEKKKTIEKLLFIDANKWLDFYRAQNDAFPRLLKQVETVKDRLIVTYLLEVEFKKNRQSVFKKSWESMERPKNVHVPNIVSDVNTSKMLVQIEDAQKRVDKLKESMKRIMASPAEDKVYQAVEQIFRRDSELVLSPEGDLQKEILARAERRFRQGYPPRKSDNDTSMGDAIHWEWMLHCASQRKSELVIISRDSDFGVVLDDKGYPNDYLRQEFKERVKGREVLLFNLLARGLEHLGVKITKEEEAAERQLEEKTAERQSLLDALRIERMFNYASPIGSLFESLPHVQPIVEPPRRVSIRRTGPDAARGDT